MFVQTPDNNYQMQYKLPQKIATCYWNFLSHHHTERGLIASMHGIMHVSLVLVSFSITDRKLEGQYVCYYKGMWVCSLILGNVLGERKAKYLVITKLLWDLPVIQIIILYCLHYMYMCSMGSQWLVADMTRQVSLFEEDSSCQVRFQFSWMCINPFTVKGHDSGLKQVSIVGTWWWKG